MPRRFYRIVRSYPPTLDDFMSNTAKGRPLLDDNPETSRLWSGISVYATETQARRKATGLRGMLGGYIAQLAIPDEAPIVVEKTLGHGHHTIWAEPQWLFDHVERVVPV